MSLFFIKCNVIFVLHLFIIVTDSKDCEIPNQTDFGNCVPEDNCDAYNELINQRNMTYERTAFLNKLMCMQNSDEFNICCPKNGIYENPNFDIGSLTQRKKPVIVNRFEEDEECGVASSGDRIFGGIITQIDEFPWSALMLYQVGDPNDLKHACGGALIDSKFVVTAAHCVSNEAFKKVGPLRKIRLGEYNLDTDEDCVFKDGESECADRPIDFNPEKVIIHPSYNPKDWDKHNDIALVELDRKAPYTDYIRPICLPNGRNLLRKNSKFTAAGWGRTDYFDKRVPRLSSIKLKVNLPPFDENECKNIYKSFDLTLSNSQLCAGGIKGFDTCRGDSGSALMGFSDKFWYIYGVASSGTSACASKGVPSIFTDVISFLPWIQSITSANQQSQLISSHFVFT